MSKLSTLTLSVSSPRQQLSPVARKRRKLIEQIVLQRKAAEAAIAGTQFMMETRRWVRTEGSNDKHLETVNKPVRPWWWTNDVGQLMFSLRVGSKVLDLGEGKTSIQVGEIANLPATLETVREAIAAGELDDQLAKNTIGRPIKPKAKPKS